MTACAVAAVISLDASCVLTADNDTDTLAQDIPQLIGPRHLHKMVQACGRDEHRGLPFLSLFFYFLNSALFRDDLVAITLIRIWVRCVMRLPCRRLFWLSELPGLECRPPAHQTRFHRVSNHGLDGPHLYTVPIRLCCSTSRTLHISSCTS